MSGFNEAYERRLEEELRLMKELRDQSTRFDFTVYGVPPSRYEVIFRCRGLVSLAGDQPQFSEEHRAEIIIHDVGPLSEDSLEIRWHTDILHPNIDKEHGPCIKGTPLGAEIRIATICEFLAEMIQYGRFNAYNHWNAPLSVVAARWVLEHPDAVPLDRTPLRNNIKTSVIK